MDEKVKNKKKSKKIIIIIAIIIALILIIPIPNKLKDGGTVEYTSLTYKVTKFHRLNKNAQTGYDDGTEIKILGIQVYNDFAETLKVEVNANEVENVSMTIKEGTLTNMGATLIITDTNEKKHGYDEWFRIDKKIDNGWEETKVINYDYVVNAIAYTIGDNGIAEIKVNWKELYGELPQGKYRIVKKLNGDKYSCIQTEFEIKNENSDEVEDKYDAKIKNISQYNGRTTILIEGLDSNDINHRGEFEFSIQNDTKILCIDPNNPISSSYGETDISSLKEGQSVSIISTGEVLESYPAQLTKVTRIIILNNEV